MLPAVFGALSFGANALGSIGGFMGAQSQARAQNKAAKEQYRQRLGIYYNDTFNRFSQYNRQKAQVNKQYGNNLDAAMNAFMAEDIRINELLKGESFNQQDSLSKRAVARGKSLASGQSGVSAQRAATLINAAYGRNKAIGRESLKSAQIAGSVNKGRIRDQLKAANDRAFATVAVAPTAGPMPLTPTMRRGPSSIGLFANLAGDALTGFNAFKTAEADWA